MRKELIILVMIMIVALFLMGCVKKNIETEEDQEKTTTPEISDITGDITKADTTNSELTDTEIDSDLDSLDQTLENW